MKGLLLDGIRQSHTASEDLQDRLFQIMYLICRYAHQREGDKAESAVLYL